MKTDAIATNPSLNSSTSALNKPKSGPGLDQALEEFEALFASALLRTARESNGSGWLGGEASAGTDGILDFAEQNFAKEMAKQGAFGIAKTLSRSLNR